MRRGDGGLEGRGRIREDQVDIRGREARADRAAGGDVVGGVLLFKNDLVTQRLGQRILEALRRGIERLVLHKLADTDGVDLAVIGTGIFGVFRGVRRGLGRGGVCRGIVRGGVRRRGLGRTGRQGQQHTSCQQDRDYILFHDNFSFSQ